MLVERRHIPHDGALIFKKRAAPLHRLDNTGTTLVYKFAKLEKNRLSEWSRLRNVSIDAWVKGRSWAHLSTPAGFGKQCNLQPPDAIEQKIGCTGADVRRMDPRLAVESPPNAKSSGLVSETLESNRQHNRQGRRSHSLVATSSGSKLCRSPLLFLSAQLHADHFRYTRLLHCHTVDHVCGMHHALGVRD